MLQSANVHHVKKIIARPSFNDLRAKSRMDIDCFVFLESGV
jgi:hypothetical protein